MRILRNTSIRRKQMLIIMLTSSIALLAACAAVVVYEVADFRGGLVENMTTLTDVIGRNSMAAIDFNDAKSAGETLDALHANGNVIAACVYDRDGQILASYHRDGTAEKFSFPAMKAAGREFKNNELQIFHTINRGNETVGTVYLVSDLKELSKRLTHYAGLIGGVFAGSLLLALLLSNRLQELISNPILRLAQASRIVAEKKNYSIRVTKQGNDEVGQLIDGFNEMLAQIQERDANLERRVEERTHDLQRENTERQRAEEALRESQALYHSLVDQLPAGVFRKDAGGRFVFINSWFCRHKNLTAEQMLGKTPQELAAYELQNRDLENSGETQEAKLALQGANHHELILQNGRQIELEEQYTGPDGRVQYLHVVKSPVFGPDGGVVGSQGILMDITQRKQAEAELDFERNLLRALMDKSDDRIYFKDAASRFIRSSTSMAQLFKLQNVEELAGKRDSDFFGEEHAREAFEDEQKIIQTGEPIISKMEKEIWPDGRVTWALSSKMPFRDVQGQIVGTFGISKDITAIKEAEEKLNRVHGQLVDASRQAGMAEVATSVLHNVGNVLNSVNVSSSLIAEKMRGSKISNINRAVALIQAHESNLNDFFANDPKGRQLPGYLSNLATHLAQEHEDILREVGSLASNIMHIKEIVAMQQSYAKTSGMVESLKVVDLVEDAIRMNNGAMTRHQVKVVRDFAEVPLILTEKHKVLQILVNLIRNAKYACDDSGRNDKQIMLRVANGNGRIKISVIDNGIGIPEENLTRIFGHGFTTRKEGHGFGLHSGALAAKELGGSLGAFSEGPGRGAAFTLELPVQ